MRIVNHFTVAGIAFLSHLNHVTCAPTTTPKTLTTATASTSSSKTSSITHTTAPFLISTTASAYPTPTVPLGGGGPFATISGRMFQIQSKVQYFAGTNSWWLSQLQSTIDVNNVFSELALSQIKVTRVWGFSETNDPTTRSAQVYFQVLNSTGQYFNFDPTTGIPILDYIVSTAEAKGVKLVMPLLNNWGDLGGKPAYNTAFGSTATNFYTDPKSQAAYKAWISLVVNRYKISPAIFAWELANEPRCSGCASSVITNWATSISAYIKSLDSRHMVALGDEGWFDNTAGIGDGSYAYTGYEGVNWVANLAIPTLDYGTFHSYPDQWGYTNDWVNTWITQHDAIGEGQGKPVVFEEYGSTESGSKSVVMQPWQQTVLSNTSVAYDSFWQFATTLSINPFDDYAIYYNTTPGSDYEILGYQHAAQMLAKNPVATM